MEFLSQNMQIIVAATAVLLVLLIMLAVWRALSPRLSGRRGQRLGITEYYEIDKSRRLVLVRRDNVEHLVMIGGAHDMVIESGITAGAIASSYNAAPAPEPSPAVRAAPRPPVFGDRKQPPLRPTPDPATPPVRPREEPEL